MPIGCIKGLKPIFITQVALLMGICYLINPLQQQIKTVFHSVSHVIETPNYVMSHQSSSDYLESHGHYEHPADVRHHDHSLVAFIDAIFEAVKDKEHSEDSWLTIDKHIRKYQSELHVEFRFEKNQSFWITEKKFKNGYFENPKEPPQYFLS